MKDAALAARSSAFFFVGAGNTISVSSTNACPIMTQILFIPYQTLVRFCYIVDRDVALLGHCIVASPATSSPVRDSVGAADSTGVYMESELVPVDSQCPSISHQHSRFTHTYIYMMALPTIYHHGV